MKGGGRIEPGKRSGKQIGVPKQPQGSRGHVDMEGAAPLVSDRFVVCDCERLDAAPQPKAAETSLECAVRCFPHASPLAGAMPGKQKTAPKDHRNYMTMLGKTGAGEGIRTLDPNLGKVVLYP